MFAFFTQRYVAEVKFKILTSGLNICTHFERTVAAMSQQISQHVSKRLVCTSGALQAKSGNNEPDRETVANSNNTLNDFTSTELSEEHMTIHKRHREACEVRLRDTVRDTANRDRATVYIPPLLTLSRIGSYSFVPH